MESNQPYKVSPTRGNNAGTKLGRWIEIPSERRKSDNAAELSTASLAKLQALYAQSIVRPCAHSSDKDLYS